jgi:hypothetical protein
VKVNKFPPGQAILRLYRFCMNSKQFGKKIILAKKSLTIIYYFANIFFYQKKCQTRREAGTESHRSFSPREIGLLEGLLYGPAQ